MDYIASIRELRDGLADVVDRAAHDEITVVTRRGREVAAVVPIAMVHEWRRWEEEHVVAMVDKAMADRRPGTPLADVLTETLARSE